MNKNDWLRLVRIGCDWFFTGCNQSIDWTGLVLSPVRGEPVTSQSLRKETLQIEKNEMNKYFPPSHPTANALRVFQALKLRTNTKSKQVVDLRELAQETGLNLEIVSKSVDTLAGEQLIEVEKKPFTTIPCALR